MSSKTTHEGKVEKPILFQPWKVKKILEWDFDLEGPMETRRVIDPKRSKCPYGKPGGLLWVRETWSSWPKGFVYKADYGDFGSEIVDMKTGDLHPLVWKPSIHMPRAACRLWLEVVDIRIERIRQVGGTSAWREGEFTVQQFIEIWDQINDKRGYGWKVNPWVWVVAYKKYDYQP